MVKTSRWFLFLYRLEIKNHATG